jgi:acyl CoA:acetate/3-ketoacid CoA transferase alpha subunit
MTVLEQGKGKLVGWTDPDDHRAWVKKNKPRSLLDKRMSASEAVSRFVKNGSFLAMGGFGHIRVSMALIYEMIRQKKRNLTLAGKTAVHDADVLIAAGCIREIEVAYSFGHELRGLSHASRRAVQEGRVKVISEISNAGYQWRFLAGMMGLPFIPTRNMLGTDTLKKSSAKVIRDPFSKKPICLVPAAHPDVVMIHVPRCDRFGNCQVDGILIEDFELARCAKRLIVTTEKIVSNDVIRSTPDRTVIPFFLVDAVVEVPFGSHPCLMPYLYYFDEEHIAEWLELTKTDKGVKQYLNKYVFGAQNFSAYLEKVGGMAKMEKLKRIENYQEPMVAPWAKKSSAKGGKP